jgi:hypothetical protein
MIQKMIRSLVVVVCMVVTQVAVAQSRTVVNQPEFVFSPKSFDSNDNAQLVIAGHFSGYCMKVGATQHSVNRELFQIQIDNTVTLNGDCSDLDMYIPYSKVIDLGALPAGNYRVMVRAETGNYVKMADLPINQAITTTQTGTTDERLYAPVTEIRFDGKNGDPNPQLTLMGYFTNSCLELDVVQVSYKSTNVIEVLPLVKKGQVGCQYSVKQFSKTITLKSFPAVDTLIHVRSMNGQSVNKIITNLDRI